MNQYIIELKMEQEKDLDIVELIEKNPITKLSQTYNGKLLTKIKNNFNESHQQLFVASFYCYFNYDQKNDFVIDLDNIWKWLGFTNKANAKKLLEKNFTPEKDYKNLLDASIKQYNDSKKHGGHNKEIFMLTVKTFKLFCIKAGTKKADEIHEYFIKLEEILQEVIHEESDELKLQLENKQKELETTVLQSQKEKEQLLEQTLISQFPVNTQCIYYGKIDNRSLGQAPRLHNEELIKFGQSNNLEERIKMHKKTFTNFRLIAAFNVKNKIEIENAIKRHHQLKKQIRSLIINDINNRELLALDNNNFTLDRIDEYIKIIIKENEYNLENYNLLLEKNNQLEDDLRKREIELKEKTDIVEKLTNELDEYKTDTTTYNQKKIASNYTICKYGYYLYAFEYESMRYKCSIVRQKDFDIINTNLKMIDNNGEMKYNTKVSYPFTEKIMKFLLKQTMTCLGNNKFEGIFTDIKKILDFSAKFEELLIDNSKDLDKLMNLVNGNISNIISNTCIEIDPEVPQIKKSKRPIDQINTETVDIIKTYESIEAAGRSLGLTTGTAIGLAVREKRVCQGFLWRYSGISKEDQYSVQPVIKVCCSTGEKKYFTTIAEAAKDAQLSAPGLRNRIITEVHLNDHHWIFDKNSSHYKTI